MACYSQAFPSPWFILVLSVAAPGSAMTFWLQTSLLGKQQLQKLTTTSGQQPKWTLWFPSSLSVHSVPQG